LSVAPVKGLRVVERDEVELGRHGVAGDRAFYLVDGDGRLANAKRFGALLSVHADYDEERNVLALTLPDGRCVAATVIEGERIQTDFYGGNRSGRLVDGPWAEELSTVVGTPLRIARAEQPGGGLDRGQIGTVSILSTASLERLAAEAGVAAVDPRRFRMSIGVDGIEAHDEDRWLERRIRIGEAVVLPRGNVGRCAATTRDPESGERTLDTLAALASYRVDGTERLPFGVWGRVVEPGRIRVGDPVVPL
jgi:uncharacterized protein YcbX